MTIDFSRLAVLGAVACSLGCSGPTEPIPGGAIPYAAPPIYRTWWQEVEACSGVAGNFDAVSWYVVPNVGAFTVGSDTAIAGYWQPYHHSITIAGFYTNYALVVRHEELHAILHRTDHPPEYFLQKCANIVAPPN